jgi:antitoxin ParD1/3/4
MAERKTITVSVTPEQHAFLGERVHSGQYGSMSEVVRAALRMLERSEPDFLLWDCETRRTGFARCRCSAHAARGRAF